MKADIKLCRCEEVSKANDRGNPWASLITPPFHKPSYCFRMYAETGLNSCKYLVRPKRCDQDSNLSQRTCSTGCYPLRPLSSKKSRWIASSLSASRNDHIDMLRIAF